ncbi:MAG: HEAT repeat domain-containing protein [Desulfuromonadales bacterium]|nr:HEAT repeat domain-containing protein [Desulfuromonadales bacterium]
MPDETALHNHLTSALTGLVKQIKALRYYPPKHPALQSAAEESLRGFRPIFTELEYISLTVRKEGFLLEDKPVAKGNQVLAQLATFCFARRIQNLAFLAELNSKDLHYFVHYLLLSPEEILRAGGIQTILKKARVTTIWTNIRDFDDILEQKEEVEEQPEEPDFDPESVLADEDAAQAEADSLTLEGLLERLEKESDDSRFQHGLQELIPLLRLRLSEENRALILRAFLLLCRCATAKQFSADRKQHSLHGLTQLATDEMTDFLLAYLFANDTTQKTRGVLSQVIAFLKERVVKRLMDTLAEEEAAPKRKTLNELLVRIGSPALPILKDYLVDDRWYVVRNAISIMGDIRSQEPLDAINPLLHHDDVRVRRETIRALTKIGGAKSVSILLQAATTDDQDLQRQAILSLGAIRATDAVPTLVALLEGSDWSQGGMELQKDTIRALGEIRSPQGIPTLETILKKKSLFHRKLNNELRTAAATALGDIAQEDCRDLLEKSTNDRAPSVARAAALALKQLNKVKNSQT